MNYYKGNKGFSYFFVPDRLLELRPSIDGFTLDLWLLLHSKIQRNQKGSWKLLTDGQIAKDAIWGDRNISTKEISRSRKILKQLGLLSYRKDGLAWQYFVVHPITGIPLDTGQAEIERKAAQKEPAESNELIKLRAELASLKALTAKPSPAISVTKYDEFDTGAVEED